MREKFIDKKFKPDTLAMIERANDIIAEYQGQGFALTLRQLYYQFVSRALIENRQTEYKRLGNIVNDGRLAGLIDWSAIEDRTRNLRTSPAWAGPAEIISASASQYQEDLWRTQPHRVEVWIEKDALLGVIEGVCEELRVPYFACRGYASQSEVYAAGKRLQRHRRQGQTPIVLHLGDHDPSGLDMTRDNGERLTMFARMGIEVRRLALNMPQIEEYSPPPNPAKDTDARFADYQSEYGDESWELDALEPQVIADLIRTEIDDIREADAWTDAETEERDNKELLETVSDRWEDVVDYVRREE